MASPKVSVIVPAFNHARFLNKRLESIAGQSFDDYEIILLDDGSTDDTPDILSSFSKHPKVSHLILNSENSGSPFNQWDNGLKKAGGEYIWIAESDDWAAPRFLETMVNQLDQYPAAGLSYAQSWKVDEKGNQIESLESWTEDLEPGKWKQDFYAEGKEELLNYFLFKNTIPNASAVVFRKSVAPVIDEQIKKLRLCGDKIFWTLILAKSDLVFHAEKLNYFRTSEQTARASIDIYRNYQENLIWLSYVERAVKLPLDKKVKFYSKFISTWRALVLKSITPERKALLVETQRIGQNINPVLGKLLQMNRAYVEVSKPIRKWFSLK